MIVVDLDLHVSRRDEELARDKDRANQYHHHAGKHGNAKPNLLTGGSGSKNEYLVTHILNL